MKKTGRKLLKILFGVFLGFLTAEIYLRVFLPQVTYDNFIHPYDFDCLEKDDILPVAMKKNADCLLHSNANQFPDVEIKTNSLGLRNTEIKLPKDPDTVRILFIGDSYTVGWGVKEEEAYPRLTESLLRKEFPGKKIEVVNAGIPTVGPNYYYLYYKNFGSRLQADIVIVGFYLLNDVSDNASVTQWLATDEDGLPTKVKNALREIDPSGNFIYASLPLKFKIPVLKYSHVAAFILDRLVPLTLQEKESTLSPHACLYKENCHDLDDAKDKTKKLFWGLKKLTDGNGAKMFTVIIPAEFQFQRQARVKYNILVPLLPRDKEYPYREFGGFFQENSIEYVDLKSFFNRNLSGEKQLYFDYDDHWTPEGHKQAAEGVAEKLTGYLKQTYHW